MKCLALYSGVLLACLVTTGLAWAEQPQREARNVLSAPERVAGDARLDLEWFKAHTQPGVPYKLNLSDPKQYRHVLALLKGSGESEARSPRLFTVLRAAENTRSASAAAEPVMAVAAADEGLQPLNYISLLSKTGERSFAATGLSSVTGGTQATNIVVALYSFDEKNEPMVYATNSDSTYTEGQFFHVSAEGNLPENANGNTLAEAVFAYVPNDSTDGTPVISYYRSEATVNPTDYCLTKPNYCVRNAGNCVGGQYQTACTNTVKNATPIKVCYYRGSQQECDYYNQSPGQPKDFVFPLKGSAQFPLPIFLNAAGAATGMTTITLENPVKGGGCYLVFKSLAPLDPANWTVTTSKLKDDTLSWNFDASAFPNPNKCLEATYGTNTYLHVQVDGLVLANSKFGAFQFTSNTAQKDMPGVAIIPQIQIQQGCLAAGTEVTMADGSRQAVENVKIGDHVRAFSGDDRVVADVSTGIEPKPMVRIGTDRNQSLLLTETHPLMTNAGMRMASRIEVGTQVQTADGNAVVTKVEREAYTGKVYNLRIGTDSDVGTARAALVANGVAIGDTATQEWIERQAAVVVSDNSGISRVRPEWRADYINHLTAVPMP